MLRNAFSGSNKMPLFFRAGLTRALCLGVAFAGLSACGGGGGGSNSQGSSEPPAQLDQTPPSVSLTSPRYHQAVIDQRVTVSGKATDVGSGIQRVSINGVSAESTDNFQNWQVKLPLSSAITSLEIIATDRAGNATTLRESLRVNRVSDRLGEPSWLAFDQRNDRLIVVDRSHSQVFSINLNDPLLNPVKVSIEDESIEFNSPSGFVLTQSPERLEYLDFVDVSENSAQFLYAIDAANGNVNEVAAIAEEDHPQRFFSAASLNGSDSLYVFSVSEASDQFAEVWVVQRSSGRKTKIGQTATQTGADMALPTNLKVSEDGQHLYFLDNDALVSMNIATGRTQTLSNRGSNLALVRPQDMALSSTMGKAWVSDLALSGIVEIDLKSGTRRLLRPLTSPSSPKIEQPGGLVYHAKTQRLICADLKLNTLLTVDTQTGQTDYLLNNQVGDGPKMSTPEYVVLGLDGRTAYLSDSVAKTVVAIDLGTGHRQSLPSANQGGLSLQAPANLAYDSSRQMLWVVDRQRAKVVSVDPASGQLALLNPDLSQDANTLDGPYGITYKAAGDALLVSDIFSDNALEIALHNQSVRLIGETTLQDGSLLVRPASVSYNPITDKLYAIDNALNALVEWDVATQTGRLISALFVGEGIQLQNPIDVRVDAANARAFVSDSELNAILSIDLNTGDRQVLSGQDRGSGSAFRKLAGIDYDPATRTLVAVDMADKSLYQVNTDNGDRKILSR